MKEHIAKVLADKKFHYLCIFLLSLLVAVPLLELKIIHTHDGALHILRLIGTNLSLNFTSFPHLVIPFICDNFGYSINAFYAPLATYLPYALSYFTTYYSEALKIFAYLTILFSGITMYHCAYEMTKKRKIALLASMIYLLAPYHGEDIYTRFALGEFTTFVFIPIVFQGLYNLLEGDGRKHWYLAVGATALVLTHTITCFYVALFCLAYLLCYWNRKVRKKALKKLVYNLVFIVGMTAFFWVVLLEFHNFTRYTFFDQEMMRTTQEYVEESALEWKDFFEKGTGSLTYHLGTFTILTLVVSIFAIRRNRKDKNYLIFLGFAVMSLILCTKSFPWKEMPEIFWQIQYPWRMLGEFTFFSSIVIAKNCEWIWNVLDGQKVGKIALVFLCALLLFGQYQDGIIRYTKAIRSYIQEDKSYEESIWENINFSIYYINRDYLPYSTSLYESKIDAKPDIVSVVKGEAQILEETKNGTNLFCQLTQVKEGTILEIPYLYYPGYVVTLKNGSRQEVLPQQESKYGMLAVEIPQDLENAELTVTYQGTVLEKASYAFSGIMCILFMAWVIAEKRKEKRRGEIK